MMMDAWKVESRGSRWRNELMIIDMLPFRHSETVETLSRGRPAPWDMHDDRASRTSSRGILNPLLNEKKYHCALFRLWLRRWHLVSDSKDIFYNSGTVSNSRSSSYTYVNGVPSCVPSERAYVWLCMRVEVEAQFDVEGALRSGLLPPLHEMHSRPRRRFASKMKTSSEKSVVFGAMGVRREGHPVTLFGQSDNSKLKPSTTSSGWAPSWHNRVTGHPAGLLALSEFCEEQTPGWPRRQINGTIIQKNSVVATSGQHRLPIAADVSGSRRNWSTIGKARVCGPCWESQACATLPVPDYRGKQIWLFAEGVCRVLQSASQLVISNGSTCDHDHFWKWTPESTQLMSRKRSPVLSLNPLSQPVTNAITGGHHMLLALSGGSIRVTAHPLQR
ncbi:hypothetical protein EDD16DRAFT_1731173, partial [Pisolithus croceorrhizus]